MRCGAGSPATATPRPAAPPQPSRPHGASGLDVTSSLGERPFSAGFSTMIGSTFVFRSEARASRFCVPEALTGGGVVESEVDRSSGLRGHAAFLERDAGRRPQDDGPARWCCPWACRWADGSVGRPACEHPWGCGRRMHSEHGTSRLPRLAPQWPLGSAELLCWAREGRSPALAPDSPTPALLSPRAHGTLPWLRGPLSTCWCGPGAVPCAVCRVPVSPHASCGLPVSAKGHRPPPRQRVRDHEGRPRLAAAADPVGQGRTTAPLTRGRECPHRKGPCRDLDHEAARSRVPSASSTPRPAPGRPSVGELLSSAAGFCPESFAVAPVGPPRGEDTVCLRWDGGWLVVAARSRRPPPGLLAFPLRENSQPLPPTCAGGSTGIPHRMPPRTLVVVGATQSQPCETHRPAGTPCVPSGGRPGATRPLGCGGAPVTALWEAGPQPRTCLSTGPASGARQRGGGGRLGKGSWGPAQGVCTGATLGELHGRQPGRVPRGVG